MTLRTLGDVVGSAVEANRDLVETIAARGHRVEGHTWSHADLRLQSEASFSQEVYRTNALIHQVTGRQPQCVLRSVRGISRWPNGWRTVV